MELPENGPRRARLDWNESPLGPPAAAVAGLIAGALRLHRYPRGLNEEVTAALAARHGVSPSSVLLTNGVDEATDLVLSVVAAAWCVTPGFDGYRHRAGALGKAVRDIPLDADWQPTTPPSAFRAGGAVFLAQPGNPTGNVFDPRWLAGVLAEAELVMVDRTYRHFDDADPGAGVSRDNLVEFTSFSKEYGLAGIRLGVLVGPEELISVLRERQCFHSVDSVSLYAARGALQDRRYLAELRRYTDEARPRFAAALSACDAIAEVRAGKANFLLARCAEGWAPERFVDALAAHGVWVKDCAGLGLPGWLRVSIGTPDDLALLTEALEALTEAASPARDAAA